MASQQQASNTPKNLRDSWQTPQWLFDWAHRKFAFNADLAASDNNAKCVIFLNEDDDALSIPWFSHLPFEIGENNDTGWCNPPYSETGKWLEKAWLEAQQGFRSVFLVPTPNGENHYRDHVFGKASEIIFINGRISFELPDGKGGSTPVNGNTRGSCLIVYGRRYEGHTQMSWVNRDDMKVKKD